MTDHDLLVAIRRIVRADLPAIVEASLARAIHSGRPFAIGIGDRSKDEPACDPNNVESTSMDPIEITEDGASSSSLPTATELLRRIRAKRRPDRSSTTAARRRTREP